MRLTRWLPNWSLSALALLVAACWPAGAQDQPQRPGLIFTGDFESGGMEPYGDSHEHTVAKTAIVDEPVRAGEHALMVTLDRVAHAQMTRHRTDFWLRGMSQSALQGRDYWYGFSTFMPEDWQADTQAELFVQWVLGGLPATDVGGPSLAIYIYGEGYCLRKRWGPGTEFRMVRQGRYKAVVFRDAPPLAFDLDEDPEEHHNLLRADAEAQAPEAVRRLLRLAAESMDFGAAERERLERDGDLRRRYAQQVGDSTGNLYLMPSGTLVNADDTLYRPEVVATDLVKAFGPDWQKQNRIAT